MKKLLVILLAFALVFGLVLTGCPNGSTGGGKKPGGGEEEKKPEVGLEEVKIEGEDIVIKPIGSSASSIDIDKNTFEVDDVAASSIGFAIDFPEEVKGKGYWKIGVEVKLITVGTPDFISFNAKADTTMGIDVLIFGHTQDYHGELKIGTIKDKEITEKCSSDCLDYTAGSCKAGATGYAEYSFSKLPNNLIAFQYNPYAGDITTVGWTSGSKATFKIEVTKVVFIPAEGEPAATCEYEDCDCDVCTGDDCECKKPLPPAPDADFNAAVGLKTITQQWGNSGAIVYDEDTGILTRTAGSSSLFNVPTTGLTITEDDTLVITYIAIATAEAVKLTAKLGGTSTDLTPATYLDLKGDGVEATLEIPASRYQSDGSFATPTQISFQDNSATDAAWRMKIISVTLK